MADSSLVDADGLPPQVSAAELVERARALVPTLRERSARTEQLRRIPEDTVADLVAAGLNRIAQPVRFGGLGHGIETVVEVAMEVGRGCPSTAWMAGQWAGHQFMVGYFPDEAQHEYFSAGPDTMSSTASAVVNTDVEVVDGGLRVTARWRFSSGCDYAQWILPTLVPHGLCLIPRSDFRIEDDWYVMGLEGTGSKQIVVDDVFIPSHRIVPFDQLTLGSTPGAALYPDNPYYKAPMTVVLNTMLQGPTIGMARGVLEIFEEGIKTRFDGHTGQAAFQRPGVQLRFAESAAEVDVAMMLVRQIVQDLRAPGLTAEPMTVADRSRLRRNVAYSVKLCMQAADRLLESGDASGMYSAQALQRWARSLHMACLQFVLTWDEPAIAYSRVRWGLESEAFTT